jgi:hypothetical protein
LGEWGLGEGRGTEDTAQPQEIDQEQ